MAGDQFERGGKVRTQMRHSRGRIAALVPVAAVTQITTTAGIASYGKLRLKTGRPLEVNTVIADMKFKADDSGCKPNMEMEGHFMFEVAFGRAPIPSAVQLKPVVETFNNSLGVMPFQIVRSASDILEPGVDRPTSLQLGMTAR